MSPELGTNDSIEPTERTSAGSPARARSDSDGGGVRFLAVFRGTQHDAKHVTNDGRMFELVCRGLEESGVDVDRLPEGELDRYLADHPSPENVISMAQSPEHVSLLGRLEEGGAYIVNSTEGVGNCYRTGLVEALRGSGVPFVRSLVVPTATFDFTEIEQIFGLPFWIKRGDIHAAHANDVVKIEREKECRDAVRDFRLRDIPDLVVQPHFEGRVVKFYAVRGTGFFHALDFETGAMYIPESEGLREAAERGAERLGLTIYGGDAVMTPDGRFVLIDFNAWPSFGDVREDAAPFMVKAILDGLPGDRKE